MLEINIDDDKRIVSVWLTKAEKADDNFRQSLKPFYQKYHNRKYKVAVYLSGEGDLLESTKALLLHNRYLKQAT